MHFKQLLFLIFMAAAAPALGQSASCPFIGVTEFFPVFLPPGNYVDGDNDGCRDDQFIWTIVRTNTLLQGTPAIPQGDYQRIQVTLRGTDAADPAAGSVFIKRFEINPDDFVNTPLGYEYQRLWDLQVDPASFKSFFIRVRLITYTWSGSGLGFYAPTYSGACDSPLYDLCLGVPSDSDPDPDPDPDPDQADLLKEGTATLNSTDGEVLIPGLGWIPELRYGSRFSYNVPCKNNGDADASNFYIETFVTTSTTLPDASATNANAVGSAQYVAILPDGGSISHSQSDYVYNHVDKFTSSGYRYFHTFVDSDKLVGESDENNNKWTQAAYYFHSGSSGRAGSVQLSHLNSAVNFSFLYQDEDPVSKQLVSQIGNGIVVALYPASLNGVAQFPVFQATVTTQNSVLDVSSLPPGGYSITFDGQFAKRVYLQ